jgi:hypothetical protein
MLESVNLPSSLLTVPVTNAVSFAVFKITFTKGKTVFVVLSFIVPETVTVLFCANEFENESVTNDIIRIVILYFVMFSKVKKRRNAKGVSPLAV